MFAVGYKKQPTRILDSLRNGGTYMIKNLSDSQIQAVSGGLVNMYALKEASALVVVDTSSSLGIALAVIGIVIDLVAIGLPYLTYKKQQ